MLSSTVPKRYKFDQRGNLTEVNILTCKSVVLPSKYVDSKNSLTCSTNIIPKLQETAHDCTTSKMATSQENILEAEPIGTNAYAHGGVGSGPSSLLSMNMVHSVSSIGSGGNEVPQYTPNQCCNVSMLRTGLCGQGLNNSPLVFVDGPSYSADDVEQGIDPGVVAVSNALFAYNSAFQSIPIKTSPNVFRRRVKGEGNSEWCNAFVTRVDPCECGDPDEQFKPYEVTKYYDDGQVKTVFNFDQDSAPQEQPI
ncbi:photosensitized INA-labeled protein 1, PhIL1, putative [Plasmodium knowlesi strain H]|uniref:Photosensitized INA-labeled protein 1, PhIL1, putative n=3 Tax=Plasmodium knowlesi TaxID=5850 RepID=A0A5K1UJB3_PLAKH|nr:uncharacterized protein PKNH_0204800 [Plasmodium knowlesi strain H]OTN66440.1 putative Photosensitized INA-labeled protein 1 - PhIL1 [Plasmodium knowlesi]CAA9986314.1 photosensitized INA-labeled protein PHIL1, putative [Plasmodium knowlesi strain H]SBO25550.1 photosensitized INA-labeled protein 1, PhIL1, putative [Plasmodium knowlesi strain H]SBO28298.1 photosensitized INA-labeled protein 1, PhIL1, putative [Plasmodium knowlesi strain H]VVS75788.1 photosensitized INA-labeled protein PHIL1, |eukprot:XP_002257719.1 [Plasmodium knowlesi strain H]